ncbi:MAG: NfeD family protein [Deltaproteobacteria bacterium]|nr:NfeD family protein [Deltaproteobacteria bacterium]
MDILSTGVLSYSVVWAILGIILIVAELMTMAFVLVFFGLGALLTAFLTWVGITPDFTSQLLVFAISSSAMLLILRTFAKKQFFRKSEISQEFIGQKVKVVRAISVDSEGAVSYRGSEWIAFSDSKEVIPAGAVAEITGMEGIRVKVRKIE